MTPKVLRTLAAIGLMILAGAGHSQSINIVSNGSFEAFYRGCPAGWIYGGGDVQFNKPSPDGNSHISVGNYLWQDLPTQPGQA